MQKRLAPRLLSSVLSERYTTKYLNQHEHKVYRLDHANATPLIRPVDHLEFPKSPAQTTYGQLQTTTLENGTVVASVYNTQAQGSVSIYVKAGTRLENRSQHGYSHFLKHLVFNRSINFSPVSLVRHLEHRTGQYTSTVGREFHRLAASLPSEEIADVSLFLLEVMRPKLREYIVADIATTVGSESSLAFSNPAISVAENLHKSAFRGIGLGNSLFSSESRAAAITEEPLEDLEDFILANYQPENFIIVSTGGIPHAELVEKISSTMDMLPVKDEGPPQIREPLPQAEVSPSKYVGGEHVDYSDSHNAHVAIGFSSASINKEEYFAVEILTKLLGGGSRYSVDGPGRGLSSRLFKDYLVKDEHIQCVNAFNFAYSDAGIFGVYGEVHGSRAADLTKVISESLKGMGKFTDNELNSAKAQAKGEFLRGVETEDGYNGFITKQLVEGRNPSSDPSTFAQNYDKVTADQVSKVATRILKSTPTYIATGDVTNTPSYSDVQGFFKL
eukprot:TRINITY_DN3723_c0_g1_i1.p1 TRINITY_DN3723_c0_g1~~TRINITY_DN3723_c0_g1_i1.p1  ORF type:complete len:502 (-),score=118.32 TRINITY_DN3723_c0_g1_i1:56-1561(-)